mgnify:CR=1 FL=1
MKFTTLEDIPNSLCIQTTNMDINMFKEHYSYLHSMNNSKNRTKSQALAIYLNWQKTG